MPCSSNDRLKRNFSSTMTGGSSPRQATTSTAADLAPNGITLPFEEMLDRRIERCLAGGAASSAVLSVASPRQSSPHQRKRKLLLLPSPLANALAACHAARNLWRGRRSPAAAGPA